MQYPAYFNSKGLYALLLSPLSIVYCIVVAFRRVLYRLKLLPSCRPPIPVVVVGNVTVGGTGKSPIVITMIDLLKQMGYTPGVVSRGYGRVDDTTRLIDENALVEEVGDEPLMIYQRTNTPFAVGVKRCKAVTLLLDKHPDIDVIISDDGLQHYALQRDVEIALVDSVRREGNGFCLPAGPLREPISRLRSIDFVLYNGGQGAGNHFQIQASGLHPLNGNQNHCLSLHQLRRETVHAVAGIGNPERFFNLLEQAGINVIRHVFIDHHQFTQEDIQFNDEYPVLMTEKDAVKCRQFATHQHWYLTVDAMLPEHVFLALRQILKRKLNG